MTKKLATILFLFLSFAVCDKILAQTINLNNDWLFQRLDTAHIKTVIENQGRDWQSQYNVTHIAQDKQLQVAEDTLRDEFARLKRGVWEKVTLPHTAKIEDLVVLYQWQGICYYKKIIEPQKLWKGKKIWLEFGAAMQLADVWVNGVHLTQHAGGYTPFVIDVTDAIKLNQTNEILVRLDNRDNPLIPPGKPFNRLDFCYYSGLYRDVNLIIKPQLYISHPILANQTASGGIFVTYPKVSAEHAIVNVKTHIVNSSPKDKNIVLRQKLFAIEGLYSQSKKGEQIKQQDTTVELKAGQQIQQAQNLNIYSPRLWSPDSPARYILQTEILVDGKVVDYQETKIGIRHIEFTKEKGFYINGKPLRLVGANRHMDYPYLGNAISNNAQYRDIYQMKESGFNIVRLGHYPQDPSVLDACDELGLLAIEPIPGWQFFNKNQLFIDLTYRDIRDLIRRDRNHPSIVMWETTLNESWPPKEWKDNAVKVAHEEFPSDQCYTSGDRYGYDGFDVSYNDWEEGFKRPNVSKNAGFIREYYDFEFGGHYSTTRIGRKDGEKALLQNAWNAQWSHNRYRTLYPQTSGDAVWSMYDYNRGCCDNICESGVADLFRLPKFSLDFFKSQTNVGTPLPSGLFSPYLFIANYWTPRDTTNNKVIIYGNVDEVELKVNGQTVAKHLPDNGVDTDYISVADAGNCKQLTHPPFTFQNIKWKKGTIEAIGYINKLPVVKQKVMTPEMPKNMHITYFESGRKAAINDVLIVYVELQDQNGTRCVESSDMVSLSVGKGSIIIGPSERKAEAGVAAFIVKTSIEKNLDIEAKSLVGTATKTYTLSDK